MQIDQRWRIAMDLHDGALQSLYALELQLEALARARKVPNVDALASVHQAAQQVQRVIADLREYIGGLTHRRIGLRGLQAELAALAEELRRQAPLHVDLEISCGEAARLHPDVAEHLLYVAREALSNVVRHAGAGRAVIALTEQRGRLTLTIRDDGHGFRADPADLHGRVGPGPAHGLQNMAARARMIGGKLEVASAPGSGSEIRVHLRLPRPVAKRSA